ncbi:uncharacterized protein LOC129779395 [Toxorhynchites rutilus septentrionalis]|uniref:uncharacterized protein LOC129779395 n=1 Tax=Toxorhynchites rutilus septentrionalis TaxID=329112 RepID=UPI00247ADF10|nr:uncharacterized protein LOC129779395 [Toxorhynchites rutilus septentrionalis]
MSLKDSSAGIVDDTRSLSKRMRAAYSVTEPAVETASQSLETLRMNIFSLIEQAKIRIHKASCNQTAALTEKQTKLLNDAIYSINSILRKQEQVATMQNNKRELVGLSGEDFQKQIGNMSKMLNAVTIEMAKLKQSTDTLVNIYSNYQLENEEECDSGQNTDSSEGNNTIFEQQ